MNVAVTVWAAVTLTTQADLPEHAPLHPSNSLPASGTAVKATTVPSAKEPLQVAPQSMPGGELVTVPCPLPLKKSARSK